MASSSTVDNLRMNSESGNFIDVFEEGLRYVMGESELNKTIEQLGSDLNSHGIEYMIIGAVALTAHGYPRFTTDVDIVLTREVSKRFAANWLDLATGRRLTERRRNFGRPGTPSRLKSYPQASIRVTVNQSRWFFHVLQPLLSK